MEIIGLLIWVGSFVGCYFLAKEKNRNEWGWFLGGVFFGIFALLLVLLLPSLPKRLEL